MIPRGVARIVHHASQTPYPKTVKRPLTKAHKLELGETAETAGQSDRISSHAQTSLPSVSAPHRRYDFSAVRAIDKKQSEVDKAVRSTSLYVAARKNQMREKLSYVENKSNDPKMRTSEYCDIKPEGPNEIKQLNGLTRNLFKVNQAKIDAKMEKEAAFTFHPIMSNLDDIQHNNLIKTQRHQKFIGELEDILSLKVKRADKIAALEQYIKQNGGIDRFSSDELNRLLVTLWNLNAYGSAMELVISSNNPVFKTSPLTLELFAYCALNSDTHFNPHVAESIASFLVSKNPKSVEAQKLWGFIQEAKLDVAATLMQDILAQRRSDDTLKKYNICFPQDKTITYETVVSSFLESNSLAIVHYSKAFLESFDPRIGLRLLHMQLESKDLDAAQKTAKLIEKACLRDHVAFSNNPAIVRAFVEACLISESQSPLLPTMEAKLIALCSTQNHAYAAYESLVEASKNYSSHQIESMRDRLKDHLEALEADAKQEHAKAKDELKNTPLPFSMETVSWGEKTASYAGKTDNVIEGNLKLWGGQLPAHEVNRYTKDFFTKLLQIPLNELFEKLPEGIEEGTTLAQIEDHAVFDDIMYKLLRFQFKTDERDMEIIDSDGHKVFERIFVAFQNLAGVPEKDRKKLKDDTSNLAWFFYNRLGDCRQVAQSQQILYELWRDFQMKKHLVSYNKALEKEDPKRIEEEKNHNGFSVY